MVHYPRNYENYESNATIFFSLLFCPKMLSVLLLFDTEKKNILLLSPTILSPPPQKKKNLPICYSFPQICPHLLEDITGTYPHQPWLTPDIRSSPQTYTLIYLNLPRNTSLSTQHLHFFVVSPPKFDQLVPSPRNTRHIPSVTFCVFLRTYSNVN